jgi:AcrR family transcriptional regulator
MPVAATLPAHPRKSPKGQSRKQAILSAAVGIFGHSGYQNASIASIAEAVGLSLPGLLHHFRSKEHLLLAILEHRDMEAASVLGLEKMEDMHWRGFLIGLCDLNRLNTRNPDSMRLFSVLNAESLIDGHPAADWFRTRAKNVKVRFETALRKGMDAGEIRADVDPGTIASEIISLMDGLQILWLRDPDTFDITTIFEAYIRRLITDLEIGSSGEPDAAISTG